MPDGLLGWALLAGGAAAAGFVQGVTGFAFAIVALSFWAYALKPEAAAPLAVLGGLTGQLASLASVRGGYEWRRILPFVLGGLVGVPFGVFVLHNSDPTRFRLVLGVLFALYALYGLAAKRARHLTLGGRGLDALVGGLGGFLGGLGGISGAVPAIWAGMRGFKRDLQRGLMQAYNIAMHITTLGLYAGAHVLTATSWKLYAIVGPLTLGLSLLGVRSYKRLSEKGFATLVLILILLSGLTLAGGAARALWGAR